jgi:ADP-heptose:LPS heptosyltransferase
MKILFCQPQPCLGDLCCSLPAIAALRQHYPGSTVQTATDIKYAKFLLGLKLSDGHINHWQAQALPYDLVIDASSFTWNATQVVRSRIKDGEGDQAVKERLRALEVLGVQQDPVLKVVAPKTTGAEGYVALHVCGQSSRAWAADRWSKLATSLVEAGKNVLLINGPYDHSMGVSLFKQLPADKGMLADRKSLIELAGLLQNCSAFVGTDNGVSHLAAVIGVPSVVLWDNIHANYKPLGARTIDKSLSEIQPEEVLACLP